MLCRFMTLGVKNFSSLIFALKEGSFAIEVMYVNGDGDGGMGEDEGIKKGHLFSCF